MGYTIEGEQELTQYRPYGTPRHMSAITNVTDYNFTDQEFDHSTDLYNYDARLYNPDLAMFITADSVLPSVYDPQMLNRYAYARNNPIIYVDPSGHTPAAWDSEVRAVNDVQKAEGGTVQAQAADAADDEVEEPEEVITVTGTPLPVFLTRASLAVEFIFSHYTRKEDLGPRTSDLNNNVIGVDEGYIKNCAIEILLERSAHKKGIPMTDDASEAARKEMSPEELAIMDALSGKILEDVIKGVEMLITIGRRVIASKKYSSKAKKDAAKSIKGAQKFLKNPYIDKD